MMHTQPLSSTKVDRSLSAAESRYQGDPVRAELLARTRRFKSSWIELAEVLTACQKAQQFARWGFASFEEYYRKELHLKQATVNKLIGSYSFLRRSEPEVLRRDGITHPFPSIEGVGFLRRAVAAAEDGGVTPELLSEVRRAVIDEGAQLGKVTKQFGELIFPKPAKAPEEQQRLCRVEVLRLAERLKDLLHDLREVPEANQAVEELEKLIRSLS